MVKVYDFCHTENGFDANPGGYTTKEPHLCWIAFLYVIY